MEIESGTGIVLEGGAAKGEIACARFENAGVVLIARVAHPGVLEDGGTRIAHHDAVPPVGCFRRAREGDRRAGSSDRPQAAVHVQPLIAGDRDLHAGLKGQGHPGINRNMAGYLVGAIGQGPRGIRADGARNLGLGAGLVQTHPQQKKDHPGRA